jgi:hypothetical protein
MENQEINSSVVDRVNLYLAMHVLNVPIVCGLPCLGTLTELIRRADVDLTMKHMTYMCLLSGRWSARNQSVHFCILWVILGWSKSDTVSRFTWTWPDTFKIRSAHTFSWSLTVGLVPSDIWWYTLYKEPINRNASIDTGQSRKRGQTDMFRAWFQC